MGRQEASSRDPVTQKRNSLKASWSSKMTVCVAAVSAALTATPASASRIGVAPALAQGGAWQALWQGAFFGLIAYATYDLTNLATLRDWPVLVTVVDITWGTVLGTLVSGGSYLIGTWLGRG